MNKAEIMETANKLICALWCCEDEEFVDYVIDAVACANMFSANEIANARGEGE